MIDGHRMNDNVYDAVLIGETFPLDMGLVERVEVIRGPGSALYGGSAFFAVVNIITRQAGALGGVEGDVEGASLGTYRARGTGGWTIGRDYELLISASHFDRDGVSTLYFPEFDDPSTGLGVASRLDDESASSLFGSGRIGAVQLRGAYSSRTKQVPTAAWGTLFGDPRLETTDARGWIDASLETSVGRTTVHGRTYVDYMGYRGTYPWETDGPADLDLSRGVWMGVDVMASRTVATRHRLTVGGEYRHDGVLEQSYYVPAEESYYVNDERTASQAAAFVQDEIAITTRLVATVGARLDWWSAGEASSLRPRAGLVFRPQANTALKVLYGEAFRPANAYERYYTDGSAPPTPHLKPESLQTTEVVVEHYVRGRLRLTAAAFHTHIEDLIEQDPEDESGTVHINRGRANAAGLELEAEQRTAAGVLLRGSLVLQRASDRRTKDPLSNAPERLATAQIAVPVADRQVTLGLDAQFVGARLTRTGRTLDAFWRTNLIATWRPQGMLSVQAGVFNLFDATYAHPVGSELAQDAIVQDGRTASVRARIRF